MHTAALLDASAVLIRLQTVTEPWKADHEKFLCEEKKASNQKTQPLLPEVPQIKANMAMESADCTLILDRTATRSERQTVDSSAENGIVGFAAPHLANAIFPAHSLQPSSSQDNGTEVFLLI